MFLLCWLLLVQRSQTKAILGMNIDNSVQSVAICRERFSFYWNEINIGGRRRVEGRQCFDYERNFSSVGEKGSQAKSRKLHCLVPRTTGGSNFSLHWNRSAIEGGNIEKRKNKQTTRWQQCRRSGIDLRPFFLRALSGSSANRRIVTFDQL